MPPRFTWHVADAWIPSRLSRTESSAETPAFWLQARLKPGISLEQAEAQLNTIAARRALERPDEYPKQFRIGVVTVIDFVVGRFRGVLYTLFAAVSLLLLIACCNLANMLLARGTVRERELTLRAAVGASRARLIRQLLIESLLLALAGAAAGCLLAYAGVAAIAHFLPQQNVPYEVELRLQWPALLVSLGTAVLAALLFGLLPAWYGARRDLLPGLKEGGKGTGANGRHAWVRHGILVGEVAISLVLVLGAGLMMRSFLTLVRGDLGFSPANIVLSSVRLPTEGYATDDARQAYYRAAIDRVAALPGVTAAATGLFIGGLPAQIERMGSGSVEPHQGRVTPCTEDYLRVHRDRSIRLVTEGLGAKPFHGRIVMLVNEHTLSAGEMVAAFASENGLARIVGTRTGGQVLGGANFSVGQGSILRFPAAGWYTWRGSIVEGRGVSPDVKVPLSLDGLRNGRDNQLECAIAEVERM